MKRVLLILTLTLLLAIPAGLLQAQSRGDTAGYTIKSMPKWVMVEKPQRVGAGASTYYFRKDRVIAVMVEYPGVVKITLEKDIEYSLDFVGSEQANTFVRDLVNSL